MIINATTGSKVTKLLSKTVGHSIEGGSKVLGERGFSIFAPANARTYDVVSGVGKRGRFQLFSFKDEGGNVVQHYTRYFKGNKQYTDVVIDTDKSTGIINRTRKTLNGTLNGNNTIEQVEHSSMLPFISPVDGKLAFQKSFMTMTPAGDVGGQEILQQSKKAAGFKYNYNWSGKPTNIEYKNTLGQKLDITETEAQYLPFINRRFCLVEQNGQQVLGTQDFTTGRVNEKIELSQVIQERLHGIKEGLLPKAKAVKQDDLVCVKMTGKSAEQLMKERGMFLDGEALPSGQINIAMDVPNGTDGIRILDRMAHEMQHEADMVAMNKGGENAAQEALNKLGKTYDEAMGNVAHEHKYYDSSTFYNKCVEQNGIFPKGTPEYDEAVKLYEMNLGATNAKDLKDLASHDTMSFEERAINREQEQMNVYTQVATKVSNFLNKLIG